MANSVDYCNKTLAKRGELTSLSYDIYLILISFHNCGLFFIFCSTTNNQNKTETEKKYNSIRSCSFFYLSYCSVFPKHNEQKRDWKFDVCPTSNIIFASFCDAELFLFTILQQMTFCEDKKKQLPSFLFTKVFFLLKSLKINKKSANNDLEFIKWANVNSNFMTWSFKKRAFSFFLSKQNWGPRLLYFYNFVLLS